MTEDEFREAARRYGFLKAGEIIARQGVPTFELVPGGNESGWVYLWVEVSGPHWTVVYVGAAGQSLAKRCREHGGGFRHSPTGRAHAERLLRGLANQWRYEVFARKSETRTILDQPGISMCGCEELALIRKFKPAWNKQV